MKILSIVITLVNSIFIVSSCSKEKEEEHRIVGSVMQKTMNISITDTAGNSLVTEAL
ncbi:MAG: hypothetical protein Q4C98_01265 [Capnocytophaga sp.]|nr:hypothetical protein [Capnocytophaga sp.]